MINNLFFLALGKEVAKIVKDERNGKAKQKFSDWILSCLFCDTL